MKFGIEYVVGVVVGIAVGGIGVTVAVVLDMIAGERYRRRHG